MWQLGAVRCGSQAQSHCLTCCRQNFRSRRRGKYRLPDGQAGRLGASIPDPPGGKAVTE